MSNNKNMVGHVLPGPTYFTTPKIVSGNKCTGYLNSLKDKATLIQSWTFAYIQLVNKHYENRVTLNEQKLSCQPLEWLVYFPTEVMHSL